MGDYKLFYRVKKFVMMCLAVITIQAPLKILEIMYLSFKTKSKMPSHSIVCHEKHIRYYHWRAQIIW